MSIVPVPGLSPPANVRSACDSLRGRFTKAVILALAAKSDDGLVNLRTAVVYGSARLRPGPGPDANEVSANANAPEHLLIRRTVDASDADSFIAAARAGVAQAPSSSYSIGYRLEAFWEGMLPRPGLTARDGPSQTVSTWRRRRQPQNPGLFGQTLVASNITNLINRLPVLAEADWGPVDLRSQISALESLDELYPIPVKVHLKHQGDNLSAEIVDPDRWLQSLGGANLIVEGYRFGMRQSLAVLEAPEAGTYPIPMHDPAVEALLESQGIALDITGGWFIGATQSIPPISGGTLPDIVELARLEETWSTRSSQWSDAVLDPQSRGADATLTARLALQRLIRSATGMNRVTVDIVDPYAVPATWLRIIAEAIPQQSTVRIVCGDDRFDADLPALGTQTNTRFERHKNPTSIPLHDRFLRLGNRMWAVGTSFNNLGWDFSSILEIRDPVTFTTIAGIIDACSAGRWSPDATS